MAWISLKTQNLPLLATVIAAQLLIAHYLSQSGFDWALFERFSADSAVMAVVILMAALLSNVLPASLKHQLVYLRRKNALPGHRFMQLAAHDQRIDLLAFQQKIMPFMVLNATEDQQNRVWYQHIYQPLQNAPLVKDAHKAFLLWRDSMVVSLFTGLLLVISMLCMPLVEQFFKPYSVTVSFCFALACGIAANNCGKRMVTNAVVTWLMQPRSNQK
ncbi:hypothetical protein [Rheinheimera sp. NSM]|uniref:hypothetical protein n=1 Tax=Rheinheimera sp. NSM TaxID=3457884 RepID=UPI0040353B53